MLDRMLLRSLLLDDTLQRRKSMDVITFIEEFVKEFVECGLTRERALIAIREEQRIEHVRFLHFLGGLHSLLISSPQPLGDGETPEEVILPRVLQCVKVAPRTKYGRRISHRFLMASMTMQSAVTALLDEPAIHEKIHYELRGLLAVEHPTAATQVGLFDLADVAVDHPLYAEAK